MSKTSAPKIGFVSLGCPKALVDSERILSQLRAEGYETAADYTGADVVVVNTCGFLDSAREESLDAIGEALAENGRVIVTGCLGAEPETIRAAHPNVIAITGPHQYEAVVSKGQALHEKQTQGRQLESAEIADFEKHRDTLLSNSVARNFLDAREKLHEIQHSIQKYISRTLELGRVPTQEDLKDHSCGDGDCGCHHH